MTEGISQTRSPRAIESRPLLELLARWFDHAEGFFYPVDGSGALGCYGTGYNHWGVQTNQKYVAALAVLSALGEDIPPIGRERCDLARERALAALRFSLRSHVTGDRRCTDGTSWGHTWISALGIERMMHGVYLLGPFLTDEDRARIRHVLADEADHLLEHHQRGGCKGVVADLWDRSGANAPESNLWNGALLWRAAAMYPDHPRADDWKEAAHRFLINAVSVADDATDGRIVAGRPVKDRHVGANFFPNYALDHHGYLNVGYMVICLSNAAMLHFDMKALGAPAPESLYHHVADLWSVTRKFIFSDGRLARIGGDTRVRYAYCQEYLLPALVFAADRLGEPHAAELIEGQLEWVRREADFNGDGSFYGKRLAALARDNPYYYTRLESDRACALGMTVAYLRQLGDGPGDSAAATARDGADRRVRNASADGDFEAGVAGAWCEPAHGAVLHRSRTRLASFAWRAHGLAQGLCQPPDDGHLAEWSRNLGGVVRFLGDDGVVEGGRGEHRRLTYCRIDEFQGGFVTCGAVMEGVDVVIPEGWRGKESAEHRMIFAALPDEHTCIGLQFCRTVGHRTYVAEVKGLHLNLPNDLFNGFQRRLTTAEGDLSLECPSARGCVLELDGRWANVEGRIGVVGIYGADRLCVHRSRKRRGGKYESLYVDEICFPCEIGTRAVDARAVVLDVGWAVLSGVGSDATRRFARRCEWSDAGERAPLRGVRVRTPNGRDYVLLANFGAKEGDFDGARLFKGTAEARDLVTGEVVERAKFHSISIMGERARVFELKS